MNGATGASDMAGKAAKVAVELCGKQPRYNEEQRGRSLRSRGEPPFKKCHPAAISTATLNNVKASESGEHSLLACCFRLPAEKSAFG